MTLAFTLNGRPIEVAVRDDESLLETLRERCGVSSLKDGCAPQGQCGCCVAMVGGKAVTTCAMPATKAAGKDIEVWLDSGIRGGQDVLKARALGARGTMIGRSFLYGLAAYGQAGVGKALGIIHKELETTMGFCGHTRIDDVGPEILLPGTYPKPFGQA